MANILADEHVIQQLQTELRSLGHTVNGVRAFCQNKAGDRWTDETVVEFAKEKKFAVLTFNHGDFREIHKKNSSHCGIILASAVTDFKQQARKIDDAIKRSGDLRGKLLDCREVQDSRLAKRGRKSRIVEM